MSHVDYCFYKSYRWIASIVTRRCNVILRVNLGLVFLWFGLLKFFPGLSPAQGLAGNTIEVLSLGMIRADVAVFGLAVWEEAIGLGLVTGLCLRPTLMLFFLQMLGTFTPLVLFPLQTFIQAPFAPTMEGQYIIKNLVLVSAGLVVYARMHEDDILRQEQEWKNSRAEKIDAA